MAIALEKFARDLLEQAEHLQRLDPKRPKQANLRRAISTAYYALFHLLISEAVANWKREERRNQLSRAFEHGQMRQACTVQRSVSARYLRDTPMGSDATAHAELKFVSDAFIQLQQSRHTADYDNAVAATRTDVKQKIDLVKDVFRRWPAIGPHPLAQEFLVALLVKSRG